MLDEQATTYSVPDTGTQRALSQFDTPAWLAQKMVEWGEVDKGDFVVEPSAGTGVIAGAAKAAGAKVLCVEQDQHRGWALLQKGHEAGPPLTGTEVSWWVAP